MERPEIVTDDHLDYLDALRESSLINMFAVGPYVESEFGVDLDEASIILKYWMVSFSDRMDKLKDGNDE